MAANKEAIFPLTPKIGFGNVTTANVAKDGTGTVVLIFTAGANGARLDSIKAKAAGTNTASVARFFINNGSDPTTATNNILFAEISLPATTLSEVAALTEAVVMEMNIALPAGYRIYVTIGTTVATNWAFTAVGGDY